MNQDLLNLLSSLTVSKAPITAERVKVKNPPTGSALFNAYQWIYDEPMLSSSEKDGWKQDSTRRLIKKRTIPVGPSFLKDKPPKVVEPASPKASANDVHYSHVRTSQTYIKQYQAIMENRQRHIMLVLNRESSK